MICAHCGRETDGSALCRATLLRTFYFCSEECQRRAYAERSGRWNPILITHRTIINERIPEGNYSSLFDEAHPFNDEKECRTYTIRYKGRIKKYRVYYETMQKLGRY
jgi:hypothetical protein